MRKTLLLSSFFDDLNQREVEDAKRKADEAGRVIEQKRQDAIRQKQQNAPSHTQGSNTTTARPATVKKTTATTTSTSSYNQREFKVQTEENKTAFKSLNSEAQSGMQSSKNSFKSLSNLQQTTQTDNSASSKSLVEKYNQYNKENQSKAVVEKYKQYHQEKNVTQNESNLQKVKNILSNSKPDYSISELRSDAYTGLEKSISTLGSPAYQDVVKTFYEFDSDNELLKELTEKSKSAMYWLKTFKFSADYAAGELGDESSMAKAKAELIGNFKRIGSSIADAYTKGSIYLESMKKHGIIAGIYKEYYTDRINDFKDMANSTVKNGFYYSPEEHRRMMDKQVSATGKLVKDVTKTYYGNGKK